MAKKSTPWSVEEVTTFLHYISDEKIQRELDGMTRNIKVFQEVSTLMATSGYSRTVVQCREKLKKLKGEYRLVKDNNNTSGAARKNWKCFDLMNSIYGHRPASVGREGGLDSATALLESMNDDYVLNNEDEPTPSGASISSISTAQTPARAQTPTPSASSTPRVVLGKRRREELELQLAQQKEHQEQNLAQQEKNLAQQEKSHAQQEKIHAELREDRALQAQYMNQSLVEAREARLLEATLRREEMARVESFNASFMRTICQVLGGTSAQSPPPL
ncbi:uncharacterized protein LOC117497723 [Trematomus bernacchii]|uniref:uncharacterized protein LOC117497723 n=1 Tax=Trematomus bernacchii TaxID=40690 RepID=UPI00146AE2C4|nr:uncharacterized protein LOC117497723 [Trematomus bernacchii]